VRDDQLTSARRKRTEVSSNLWRQLTDVRLGRVHLKVLPTETLRDPDSPPLVLFQDAQEAGVVAGEVAVGGRKGRREAGEREGGEGADEARGMNGSGCA
jgi:hypothetical protein